MYYTHLHRYPFLRLLIPLIVGILCGDYLYFQGIELPLSLNFCLCGFLLFGLVGLYFLKRFSLRWLFGIFASLFIGLGGALWSNYQMWQVSYSFPEKATIYRIRIIENPEIKERSLLCRSRLLSICDSLTSVPVHQNVLLYFPKGEAVEKLKDGDELLVYAKIASPVNGGNPDEFDYVRYLTHKEISGTGYVTSGNWRQLSCSSGHTFRQKALGCRESLLALYRRLGFTGDEFAVLSALTVGYKEELSEDIRETYSVSGASHVLALSGLHIGFLYALLFFCVKWIPTHWKGEALLRIVIIVFPLWAFAFFTGLSPSVVRSVSMFSLLAVANALNRNNSPLNTLSIAAFCMLLWQPCWLFDVGFQLSFCAVAAIILIYPWLYRRMVVKNRILKYIWSLLAVSLAAQIGTAPLVLLYFSRFSTHFLLTNLLVIPLVSLIMYMAVLMLIHTPFHFLQAGIAMCVRWLIELLNSSVRWVEHLPFSSFDRVWIYPFEVFGFYITLFMFMRYIIIRSGKSVCTFLVCVFLLSGFHLWRLVQDVPRQSIVFYNVRGCPATHCISSSRHSWLAYADSLPDTIRLSRIAGRYWDHYHLFPPRIVTADYTDACFSAGNRILLFGGKRICQVNDNRWRNKTVAQPLFIDYLYICKGYTGRLEWLTQLFIVQNVILDASLSDYRKKAFCNECRQLGLHFVALADEGSVQFLL